jgi:hypothetical protein
LPAKRSNFTTLGITCGAEIASSAFGLLAMTPAYFRVTFAFQLPGAALLVGNSCRAKPCGGPHKRISREPVKLPPRSDKGRYSDKLKGAKFVAERY